MLLDPRQLAELCDRHSPHRADDRNAMDKPKPAGSWDSAAVYALRRHLGCTQAEFARTVGVRSQQTVSAWECGVHPPSGTARRLLSLIAAWLGPDP